jgi:hypothetical protein
MRIACDELSRAERFKDIEAWQMARQLTHFFDRINKITDIVKWLIS